MGERAIIEKGMNTLAELGQGESTKFVLPQELTSMVGRYGKHLSGSDVKDESEPLAPVEFDDETRELLGLDGIEETLDQLDEEADSIDIEKMEQEAEAIKTGADPAEIKSADEVIEEMDEEIPEAEPEPEEPEAEVETETN